MVLLQTASFCTWNSYLIYLMLFFFQFDGISFRASEWFSCQLILNCIWDKNIIYWLEFWWNSWNNSSWSHQTNSEVVFCIVIVMAFCFFLCLSLHYLAVEGWCQLLKCAITIINHSIWTFSRCQLATESVPFLDSFIIFIDQLCAVYKKKKNCI